MPVLFGVVLLDLIGFGIVIPILPFLSPQLGADKLDVAYIIVAYAVGAGLCAPFWGRLSDRIGRKPVIMICLGGAAVSYVMLGLASALWMVYAARAFAGLMAGNVGVASAMMADITRPENRARGMGLIGAAFGLGLVLGPMLGGLLSGDEPGFLLPCAVAGVMSVLAMVAAAIFLPESLSADRQVANRAQQHSGSMGSTYSILRRGGNRLLVLQFCLHNLCVSSLTYMFPLWAGDTLGWGPRQVGIVFGIQGAIMVVVQGGLMGLLVRKLGELRLLRIAVTGLVLGLFMGVCADGMVSMVASIFVAMTGATLCMPLLNAIVSHRTPVMIRGRMLGVAGAAASWGRVAGPLLAGGNLALFGYHGAWLGSLLVSLAYMAWCYREYARYGRNPPAEAIATHGNLR
ncbi:MAG: MFS transporter [Gammaproteobacteria bacterium]|jgi:DHA1 family tetracycline resistance protein-like MFS transporter|nr:MFS transporter [Gammaproteobacteria bacterium]MDH5170782.1 MFS transporter [Gammaproteobacteria bacterium]